MPVEADEIAGPPALFERLDVVPEIGQKFQIPLRIQGGKVENYDFTITGILEQPYQYNDYEYFSSQKGIGNFAGNRFV